MKKLGIIILIVLVLSVSIFIMVNLNSNNRGDESAEIISLVENGEVVEIDLTAKRWEFEPQLIEVNLGDTVELHLESVDVPHGIVIPEYGISERLNPGEDIHVEFIADKKGTFGFYCSVPCGSGHSGMSGLIVVK